MKLSHLKQIIAYLENFGKIFTIYRVADSLIKISFEKNEEIYFDLTRSNSKIYKAREVPRTKLYNAPFDVVLAKRFAGAVIEKWELVGGDKVLRIHTAQKSSYKLERTILQLEFTGRHTNAIVLDEDLVVLEALRHIDAFASWREVRVGSILVDLPPPTFEPKEYPLDDVKSHLYGVYEQMQQDSLKSQRQARLNYLQKKQEALYATLAKLQSEADLLSEAKLYARYGELFLSQMTSFVPYAKSLELKDYDGSSVFVDLEREFVRASSLLEYFYARSKRAKQKASNLHLERKNLEEKIAHLEHFKHSVKDADPAKLSLLSAKTKQQKSKRQDDNIESFFIEGYKVSLGKNERGNIALLKSSKARDVWLHLKDRASTHVIISTDKQSVPAKVLEAAARLCVDFSVLYAGRYLVDYTHRREVSVQNGANVLYNNYKTIEIVK